MKESPMHNSWARCFVVLLVMIGSTSHATGDVATEIDQMVKVPPADGILRTLKPEHPRLLLDENGFAELVQTVKRDDVAKRWYRKIKRQADKLLNAPVCTYSIPDGKRLLATSRQTVDRIYHWGLMYRLGGDRKYADRVWKELEAAAKFPDWNPSHFLDTAEMCHAFAIGYDWCFDAFTDAQRKTLREAIVKHGLRPATKAYRGNGAWFPQSHRNWNQVCNGGIMSGALAIAENQPKLAAEIIHSGAKSLPLAMRSFNPDGGWFEGPGYWSYATRYNVMIVAALDSALGTDFGLSRIVGFRHCGDFPIYMTAPSGEIFNFADAKPGRIAGSFQMQWLSQRYDRPEFAATRFELDKPHPCDLVWFDPRGKEVDLSQLPLDKMFTGVQAASMRSAWDDSNAAYVGIKAGKNGVNHDNLDLGSFIYEINGVRWAVDLGAGNYNLSGYFNKGNTRYNFYRMRAEGHNTILVNPGMEADQQPKGKAKFTRFVSKPDYAAATVDLADAYRPHVKTAVRGFRLDDHRTRLTVSDRVVLKQRGAFWWFMHTQAKVEISDDGRSAKLTKDGQAITVSIARGPGKARFALMPARPLPTSPDPEGQNPNNGAVITNGVEGRDRTPMGVIPIYGRPNAKKAYRKLAIHLEDVQNVDISVMLVPVR